MFLEDFVALRDFICIAECSQIAIRNAIPIRLSIGFIR